MRHVINFFITGVLMLIFQSVGLITLANDMNVFQDPFANQLLAAGVVGFVFTVGLWIAGMVWGLLVVFTCGVGCLLAPLYYGLLGVAGFWAVGQVLPGWVHMNTTNPWAIALMGIVIAIVRIHAKSTTSSDSN